MTITIRSRLSRRAFVAATGAAAALAMLPAAAQTSGALQIWFVRHAESEINVPGSPRPVPDGGVSYPLTRKGVEQAKALAQATAATPILAIYTSTHLRAVQTADALAFRHDLTLQLAPEAVEIDLGIKPGSAEDARAVYLELARKWTVERDLEARHGDGESFADVQRRFLPFVREVMNRHSQDSGVVMIGVVPVSWMAVGWIPPFFTRTKSMRCGVGAPPKGTSSGKSGHVAPASVGRRAVHTSVKPSAVRMP